MFFLDNIPLWVAIVAALTLGLAPFVPEPHLVEKLRMLFQGTLTRPVDVFDLCLHAAPWLLVIAKLVRMGMTDSDLPNLDPFPSVVRCAAARSHQ